MMTDTNDKPCIDSSPSAMPPQSASLPSPSSTALSVPSAPSDTPKGSQQLTATAETKSPSMHSSAPRQPSSCPIALHWGDSDVAAHLTSQLPEFHRRVCERLDHVLAQQQAQELLKAETSKMGTISPVHDFAPSNSAYSEPSLKRRLSSTSPSPPAGFQKLRAGQVISLIPAQDGNPPYFKLEKGDDFSWWEVPTPDYLIKD